MSDFIHQRHKPPAELDRPRELIVACAPMRSNVNLSRIVRVASCCGRRAGDRLRHGQGDRQDRPRRRRHDRDRSPSHAAAGAQGAEARRAISSSAWSRRPARRACTTFAFERKTVLVVGNERPGLADDVLALLDHVVEIPVYGLPYSYNVATAAAMALYEYCRQFPARLELSTRIASARLDRAARAVLDLVSLDVGAIGVRPCSGLRAICFVPARFQRCPLLA